MGVSTVAVLRSHCHFQRLVLHTDVGSVNGYAYNQRRVSRRFPSRVTVVVYDGIKSVNASTCLLGISRTYSSGHRKWASADTRRREETKRAAIVLL